MRILINDKNEVVKKGDTITNFRGEKATVTGWQEPQHGGSTGRIHTSPGYGEHFPSVFDCKFLQEEDTEKALFSLFVGGDEVNNYYMTYQEAEELAEEYQVDDYDTCIVKMLDKVRAPKRITPKEKAEGLRDSIIDVLKIKDFELRELVALQEGIRIISKGEENLYFEYKNDLGHIEKGYFKFI